MKVHKVRTFERWGGEVRTSLCGRLNARCSDGMNVTNVDAEVTCHFCRQRLDVAAARARPDDSPDDNPAKV